MPVDGRGLKVMVVDSDRTVLELLQIRLDVAGYHACVARDARSALDMLKMIRPAALVLELNLPDISGYEFLQSLTARGAKPTFPILVTGRGLAVEDVQRAVSLGAQTCMLKPFSGGDMLERIGRLLAPRLAAKPPTPEAIDQDLRQPAARKILLVE